MIISLYNGFLKRLSFLVGKHAFVPLFLIFCVTISLPTYAQTEVRGKVTDEAGKPVPSASVMVRGTSRGTSTDENGAFAISVSRGSTLVVSSVGFANKEIRVGNESNLAISLTATNQQLDQVIVIGYGTQKRATVTGAISSVSGKTITELPVAY